MSHILDTSKNRGSMFREAMREIKTNSPETHKILKRFIRNESSDKISRMKKKIEAVLEHYKMKTRFIEHSDETYSNLLTVLEALDSSIIIKKKIQERVMRKLSQMGFPKVPVYSAPIFVNSDGKREVIGIKHMKHGSSMVSAPMCEDVRLFKIRNFIINEADYYDMKKIMKMTGKRSLREASDEQLDRIEAYCDRKSTRPLPFIYNTDEIIGLNEYLENLR